VFDLERVRLTVSFILQVWLICRVFRNGEGHDSATGQTQDYNLKG